MPGRVATTDLQRFKVSRDQGFLPAEPPLQSFDSDAAQFFAQLDELAAALPELLEANRFRARAEDLAPPATSNLQGLSPRTRRRVYTIAGFLANAYVNQPAGPAVDTIPAGIAVPLYEMASTLGRTPVLSYDGYVLHNWRRIDAHGRMRPHNLQPNLTFTDLEDERWFIALHAAIESRAGPALAGIGRAQQAIVHDDRPTLHRALRTIEETLHEIVMLLNRMSEHNHPEQYGRGFRPYLDALTNVTFEAVEALDGPQSFRGASGAQSTVFPALDAAIGIDHGDNPLVDHLQTLRRDMPPAHRDFIEAAAEGPDILSYVDGADQELQTAFDECIDRMVRFREDHRDVVQTYLAVELNETEGTGGTPYDRFLSMFVDNTRECKLAE